MGDSYSTLVVPDAVRGGVPMKTFPIVTRPNPILAAKAERVTTFDKELRKLVRQMFETMYEARGVGLAAPQIGVSKQVAVIDVTCGESPDSMLVLINPIIIHFEGLQTASEGCLSIPGARMDFTRPQMVVVEAQDDGGDVFRKTGYDLLARAFMHEYDHLQGILLPIKGLPQ